MYSEIVWVVLYTYTILIGSSFNDLTVIGTSLYILALAGLEFSIGMLLLIYFKNNNKSLIVTNQNNIFNKKKTKTIKI